MGGGAVSLFHTSGGWRRRRWSGLAYQKARIISVGQHSMSSPEPLCLPAPNLFPKVNPWRLAAASGENMENSRPRDLFLDHEKNLYTHLWRPAAAVVVMPTTAADRRMRTSVVWFAPWRSLIGPGFGFGIRRGFQRSVCTRTFFPVEHGGSTHGFGVSVYG